MDERTRAVGQRIRSVLPASWTQASLAVIAEMTPDAMSRALNGQRGFSMVELTAIAHALDVDLHWLVTGEVDPHRVSVAARHNWDPATRTRSNPGREADDEVIATVQSAYHAAYPDGAPPTGPLATNPAHVRERLGNDFVRHFAERAEDRLGIDVVRLPGLSTDYSISIGSRSIILLATDPWWFRSNWSLAHEIGHLARGHHDTDAASDRDKEDAADDFAAELLLPRSSLKQLARSTTTPTQIADFLWEQGVSASALHARLAFLRITVDEEADAALVGMTTPRLLSTYGVGLRPRIADRKQRANARRMPVTLLTALTERVEGGDADPQLLAWALDVPVDEVDFPEADDAATAEHYRLGAGMKPDADVLAAWLSGQSER